MRYIPYSVAPEMVQVFEIVSWHSSDVIMGAMASQITGVSIIYWTVQAQVKKSIKAPRHWPLWGEFAGHRWIPLTKGK